MLLLSAKYSGPLVRREETPLERRFGMPLYGPVISFGAMVEYHPISAKDIGPKVLPGVFLGYVLYAGGIWKGHTMVADIDELEHVDASEIHARRLNAKEVFTPMKGEKIMFPVADGTVKNSGVVRMWQHPPWSGTAQTEEKNKILFEEKQTGLLQPHDKTLRGMMVKLEMISGPSQATFFTVITWNPESTCTCRERSHSLFHWNT